jgi:hypothetical protein
MVLALCERFGCLPSQLYAEDASLLRMLRVVQAGTPDPVGGEPGW